MMRRRCSSRSGPARRVFPPSARRIARTLCLTLCVLLALPSCAAPAAEEDSARLWYRAEDGTSALGWEPDAEGPLGRFTRLINGPSDPRLLSPFPAGLRLLEEHTEDGVLSLLLSEEYDSLRGVARTLADACLTLTLCQSEEVEAISISVAGSSDEPRTLSPADLLLSGSGEEPVYVTALLYFPRVEGRGLGVEYRTVLVPEGKSISSAIAAALLTGPLRDDLRSLMPAGTELIEASVSDRVCTVNLSAAYREGLSDPAAAHLMVYSLVDTLGNLDTVSAVHILVDGEPLEDLPEIPISRALEPDFRLIED